MSNKKLCLLILIVFTTIVYPQKKPKHSDNNNRSLIEVVAAAGIAVMVSTFNDDSNAVYGNFFELSSTYYFSKMGVGVSLGRFSNTIKGNNNQVSYPIKFNSEKWETYYYSIGPSYITNIIGLDVAIFGQAGLMSVKPFTLKGDFIPENQDPVSPTTSISVYSFSTEKTINTGFYKAGVNLGYKLNSNFKLHLSAYYLSAFSDKIISQEGKKSFVDINNDGVITEIDIVNEENLQLGYEYTEKNMQPQVFNFGLGLSYSFGIKKK